MARGGARAHSGPKPDLDAYARLRDKSDWIYLPAESNMDAPDWPLTKHCNVTHGKGEDAEHEDLHWRELQLWDQLWQKGQAIMWAIDGLEFQVAMYCRAFTKAEATMDITSSGMLAEIRRQEEGLGLNTSGLLRNKWRFEASKEHTVEAHEKREDVGEAKQPDAAVVDLFPGVARQA